MTQREIERIVELPNGDEIHYTDGTKQYRCCSINLVRDDGRKAYMVGRLTPEMKERFLANGFKSATQAGSQN